MIGRSHDRFEMLAGAVALGEASDAERAEFESHIAECARCRQGLGGEFELRRIRNLVVNAREAETWAPDLSATVRVRVFQERRRRFRLAFSALGGALALSLLLHFGIGSGMFGRLRNAVADPPTIHYEGQRIILEPRSARDRGAVQERSAASAMHKTTVVATVPMHQTVVVVAANPSRTSTADRVETKHVPPAPLHHAPPRPAPVEAHEPVAHSGIGAPALVPHGAPGTELGDAAPARIGAGDAPAFAPGKQSAANVVGSAPPPSDGDASNGKAVALRSEPALVPSYVTREPLPIGGESAIRAEYSTLAEQQRAEGTVAVEVAIDASGAPQNCTVVQSSGYLVLDDLLCKAVRNVRYRPAMTNGKAVPGVFRFTRTYSLQ